MFHFHEESILVDTYDKCMITVKYVEFQITKYRKGPSGGGGGGGGGIKFDLGKSGQF